MQFVRLNMTEQRFNILKFLEEYERFPCLWKKTSSDFKNRSKRDHAEERLLVLSGLSSIKELRQKIRSIRCTYNQEITKIKKSMGTGTGTKDVYTPKLAWFPAADSFLRQNMAENDSESNLVQPAIILEEILEGHSATEATWEEHTTITATPEKYAVTQTADEPLIAKPTPRLVHKSKKSRLDDSLDNAVEVLKHVAKQSTANADNEFTRFGQHIASQLHCLPLHEAIQLQEDIQKLITSARLRSLGANESTCAADLQNSTSVYTTRSIPRNTYVSETIYSSQQSSPQTYIQVPLEVEIRSNSPVLYE